MAFFRRSARLSISVLVLGLAACASSPPVSYYTLQAPQTESRAPVTNAANEFIEVMPVTMAASADYPHLMVRVQNAEVSPLYSQRWTAPLADEFRAALSAALVNDLGAVDMLGVRPTADAPMWRIQTDVQRFELQTGVQALLDVTWRIRPVHTEGRALLCRSTVHVPVMDAGALGLVQAQQKGVMLLSATIASAIRAKGQGATFIAPEVQLHACTEIKG